MRHPAESPADDTPGDDTQTTVMTNIFKFNSKDIKKEPALRRPFSKVNFIMMGGCLLLIIVGFLLMSGGGSSDQVAFNPEVFSTRRIVVGPLLTFLGFLLMAFAIIYTPRKKK